MIAKIIDICGQNRLLVILFMAGIVAAGIWAMLHIGLDAIPDLSDVQVIIMTDYPGQAPDVVNNQVTYPLATAMMGLPRVKAVRSVSMFEESFVYVIFDEGTDLYWARSRVLEDLSFVRNRMPAGVEPRLGPDATGVGWVYQYVLYPGYYCANHPGGIWHDVGEDKWYASPTDAPADRRADLVKVRGFEKPGKSPLDGTPLVSSNQNLASLRGLQDWYLRYQLTGIPGVAEVASIGGFVKEYQVVLKPEALLAYNLPIARITQAIQRSNNDVGGSVVEMSENEYMVRSRGYLRGLADLGDVPVGVDKKTGTPILLKNLATLQIAGQERRGVSDWDGEGEAVGGIVIARYGANALDVIRRAKAKLSELENGLPPGVVIKTGYDRSDLIHRSIHTLRHTLIEEMIVVSIVCIFFLLHLRSALVAIFVIPSSMLVSILAMYLLGIDANIMSLGGIAIAIGVVVDSAIVMVENAHKHLAAEQERVKAGGEPVAHASIILEAAKEVGPSLFFSLLIIAVSFTPIFVLVGEEGRLFRPLAFTKTFAMAAAAALSITIVPVLMIYFIRGKLIQEERNPISRLLQKVYAPFFLGAMKFRWVVLLLAIAFIASAVWPWMHIGSELMPPLNEGDLLYMPTTDPSISITTAKQILQQTDKLLMKFPEVISVDGKIGRADTATDPAPLDMIETVVRLQTNPARWRRKKMSYFFSDWPGILRWPFEHTFWPNERPITMDELVHGWTDAGGTRHAGMDEVVHFPGLSNTWTMPIANRTNMLATGIKTPVGIKIMGPDLNVLSHLASQVSSIMRTVQGTTSVYAERTEGGYYLDIDPRVDQLARYGLTKGDLQDVVRSAIGGMQVTTTVEGLQRYPVNIRYARDLRDKPDQLAHVLVFTPVGAQIPLGELARIHIDPGPPMIRSENAMTSAWVYIDFAGRDMGSYVADAQQAISKKLQLPTGYTLSWSGQYEIKQQNNVRWMWAGSITLAIIILLLYSATNSWFRTIVVLLAVPFSIVGATWFLWMLSYNFSGAVIVGLIALAGLDAETGVLMLLYLDNSYENFKSSGRLNNDQGLRLAIHDGAVKRIRPKTMTVAAAFIGLLPLLWATGAGADVMRRIAAPMLGGLFTSFLMELLIYPVIFYIYKRVRS